VMAKLTDAELASKLDSMRSLSEAEAQRLQVRVSSEQAALDTSNAKVTLQDRNIQVSSLRTEVVAAENNLAIEQAKLQTLEYEIERRTVRARATGTISDAIGCAPGITVTPATRLGTLLPRGEVHVVAHFEPRDVIGRATRGDKAIIRVENFPWTQFGTLAADVREVGSEPRDGLVRVELGVTSNNPQIPATHGLTATAEIEIERLSPARLLLRMAGQGSGNERKVSGASDAPASVANATPNALAR
jgi:multidrug resistance efflux pump